MAKKRRKDAEEKKEIVFDPKARYKYLTGFRKRKAARRKKAVMEDLEAERKDLIDVKKQHREEVKQRWKELKNAEKRIDKILGLEDGQRPRLALKNIRSDEIEEGDVDSPVGEQLQMITFEQEDDDDDPFGGCEVTTTIPNGLPGAGGQSALKLLALANGPSEAAEEEGPGSDEEETALMVVPPEDPEVRARRRAENIAKAEGVRKKALAKRAAKLIELKEKQKKLRGRKLKNKKKGKRGKTKKDGAKARRKRK